MLLSIIIPLFNNATSIKECLRSIADNNTLDDVEIIVVDDGSADDSHQVAHQCAKELQLPNFHIEKQPHQGVSTARNQGIKLAKGQYIWFIDADDTISSSAISNLLQTIHSLPETTDLFKMGTLTPPRAKHPNNSHLPQPGQTHSVALPDIVFPQSGCLDHTTYLFDRNFLLKNNIRYPEGTNILEDSLLMLNALGKAQHIETNPTFHFYQLHPRQTSTTRGRWSKAQCEKYIVDIQHFFNEMEKWLLQQLSHDSATAFWSRYVEVYLRVLSVKCAPWHIVRQFRHSVFKSHTLPYHPKGFLGKILKNSFLHYSFSSFCIITRPIAKLTQRIF